MIMEFTDSTFKINSINPWRMLLFGSLGVLLPITIYILLSEYKAKAFLTDYTEMIDLLFIPVLITSILGGYLGFKYSAYLVTININAEGLSETIKPGLFFLREKFVSCKWQEIATYSLTEDSKGKILEITLHSDRKISIGIAYVLNKSEIFDKFYSNYINHLTNYNQTLIAQKSTENIILKSKGFYESKTAKIIAIILLTMMLIVIFIFLVSDKKTDLWYWFRLLFFELLGGAFVWRTLFTKS